MQSYHRIVFLVLAIMSFLTISVGSWAETNDEYMAAYSACTEKAETFNNSVVYACSSMTSEIAEKEINRLYEVISQQLTMVSKSAANKFEQSQKSWLEYKQSHCELMGSYVGSPMYTFCPMQLNIARVQELTDLADR